MNKSLIKSAYFNAILSAYKVFINFLQLVIISRILGPEPFSYMAVMVVIFNVLNTMTEIGVGTSLLSKRDLSSRYINSVLKISLLLAFIVGAIALGCKYYVVEYFNRYDLSYTYEIIIALLFPVAISQVYRSLGERKMEFLKILKIESFSISIGFIVTYYISTTSYILYALPIGYSVNILSNSFLYWINFKYKEKIKEYNQYNNNYIDITKFGLSTLLANILNTINNQLDSILIGSHLDKFDFGNYSLAKDTNFKIHSAINPILGRVYLPHMAGNYIRDANSLLYDYKIYVGILVIVNTAFYMPFIFYSSELVNLIWGEKWLGASDLFSLFAVWGLVRSCMNPIGTIIYAARQPRLAITSSLVQLVITVPLMLLFVRFSVYLMAIGQIIIMILSYLITWKLIVNKIIKIDFYSYSLIAIRPIFISFIIFSIVYFILQNYSFITNILLATIVYIFVIWKINLSIKNFVLLNKL